MCGREAGEGDVCGGLTFFRMDACSSRASNMAGLHQYFILTMGSGEELTECVTGDFVFKKEEWVVVPSGLGGLGRVSAPAMLRVLLSWTARRLVQHDNGATTRRG